MTKAATDGAAATPVRSGVGDPALLVLAVSLVIGIAGAMLVSDGLFNIDEAIYLLGAQALRDGSFVVGNGWDTYGADSLRLWFLRAGPDGLVPQYPPGTAIAAAPLLDILGPRSFILLNAVCAAFVLWMTFLLARRFFDQTVALIAVPLLAAGTFLPEYAFGIWPHTPSMAAVLAAFLLAVVAAEAQGRAAVVPALCSGLAVGLGLLFRLDTVLILPTIGVLVLWHARSPATVIAAGATGAAVGTAVAATLNLVKFGSLNPFSYGPASGGGTDITNHLMAAAGLGVAILLLLAARRINWSRSIWVGLGVVGAAALGALVLFPATQSILARVGQGAWGLFYDATTLRPTGGIVEGTPGHVLLFGGLPKKALIQSMPWLAVLAVLLVTPATEASRKWVPILLLAVVVWSLPYVPKAWYGGFGSNMRYYLPIVPLLAILGALALSRLLSGTRMRPAILLLVGLSGAVGALLFPTIAGSGEFAYRLGLLHQIATRYLFLGLLGAVLLIAVSRRADWSLQLTMLLTVFAMGVAAKIAIHDDLGTAQAFRLAHDDASAVLDLPPGPALLYGPPQVYAHQFERPDTILAMNEHNVDAIDHEFLKAVIADGYRVWVPDYFAEVAAAGELPGLAVTAIQVEGGVNPLREVVLSDQ